MILTHRYLRAAFSIFLDGSSNHEQHVDNQMHHRHHQNHHNASNAFLFWQYAEDFRLAHPHSYADTPTTTITAPVFNSATMQLSESSMFAYAQGIYQSFLAPDAPFPLYHGTDLKTANEIQRIANELSIHNVDDLVSANHDETEDTIISSNDTNIIINNIRVDSINITSKYRPSVSLFSELQLQAYVSLREGRYVRFIIQPDYLRLLNLAVFTRINVSKSIIPCYTILNYYYIVASF